MNGLRLLSAVSVFCISIYLVVDLFIYGFSWLVLACCILGFVSVHFIRPEKKDGERRLFDLIDLTLDFPYRVMATLIRGEFQILRDRGDGFDIGI
jgi:hypothetical protein